MFQRTTRVEVVQVYFDPLTDDQPIRLVGWTSASIAAGEQSVVTVDCDHRMWRTWNTALNDWSLLSGGELVIARGLGDIRCRLRLD